MLSLLRRTYPETANLAVNQTLMRSLNTSLIALLPVAGLLVAGVAVLGGGTLKDLALVLLVGMLVGAYSSIFVAVPIAVDLKIREPAIIAHTARVLAKRKHDGIIVDADGDPIGRKTLPGEPLKPVTVGITPPSVTGLKAGAPPKPGVKPQRPGPIRRRPRRRRSPRRRRPPPAAPTPTVIDGAEAPAELAATEVEAKATTTPAAAPAKSGRAGRQGRPTDG